MDCHARRVLQAISRSRHIGVASSSLNCNLNSVDSPNSLEDSSCLHIARYLSSLEWDPNDAHIDRGLLTLVWSDCTSGLQVCLHNIQLLIVSRKLLTGSVHTIFSGGQSSSREAD